MATKSVQVPDIGTLKLYKRRGARSIRLSVAPDGEIRVHLPYWVPYSAGVQFAKSRQAWIAEQLNKLPKHLKHGQLIGKTHRIYFESSETSTKPSSRVTVSAIRVTHPFVETSSEPHIQAVAVRAATRALRAQAEASLPDRLKALAAQHGFSYRSVQVKQLRGRWGSCDQDKNIVLNLFLMQLPWELIDYVLLHELTHTEILRHGSDFWVAMKRRNAHSPLLRKAIREYRPAVGA